MVKTAGSFKTHGAKIGETMALGINYYISRCILINQEELGIERFTLAVALNNENIEEGSEMEYNLEGGSEEAEQPEQQDL